MGLRSWRTDDELDVRFYLCDAPGLASGMKSNLGPQLEALELGFKRVEHTCTDPDEAMVNRLDHAARAARVRRVLMALSAEERDVLFAAYGGQVLPKAVRVRFGDELGAVVLHLAPGATRHTEREQERLHQDARAALEAAQAAYAKARS